MLTLQVQRLSCNGMCALGSCSSMRWSHDKLKRKLGDSDNNEESCTISRKSQLHVTATATLPQVGTIPLPANVEELNAGQKVLFSRQRIRDLAAPMVLSQQSGVFGSRFMSDQVNHCTAQRTQSLPPCLDTHVDSYDCFGMVSLHSVMQTNVPNPFKVRGKAPSHLNMPGGGWGQGHKYLAEDLQKTHPRSMEKAVEGDEDEGMRNNTRLRHRISNHLLTNSAPLKFSPIQSVSYSTLTALGHFSSHLNNFASAYSTSMHGDNNPLTRKEKLKKAVKDYGATVVIFHVGISLISLGGCYMAVSSGVDIPAILSSIGLTGSIETKQMAVGASTFMVAYAIHKVFAPVRIAITLMATPVIVHYLRRIGILKVPKAALKSTEN